MNGNWILLLYFKKCFVVCYENENMLNIYVKYKGYLVMVFIVGDLYGKSKEGKMGFDLKIIIKRYKSMVLNYCW